MKSDSTLHHRRPPPVKSQPVDGWTFDQDVSSPHFKPLFGSFQHCLSVNKSPQPAQLDSLDDGSIPLESPALRGESVMKQRGKIAIGVHGNEDTPFQSSWGQPQFEFGQFDQPPFRRDSRHASRPSMSANSVYRGGGRRGSFGDHPVNGGGSYRASSMYSGNGGRRGRGAGRHYRSGSYSRTSVSGSYRGPPHIPRNYSQFEGVDPYMQAGDPHYPYYGHLGSFAGPPHYPAPFFGSFGIPVIPPFYPSLMPLGVAPTAIPPVPIPITQPGFPLDPQRYYLLGQVRVHVRGSKVDDICVCRLSIISRFRILLRMSSFVSRLVDITLT